MPLLNIVEKKTAPMDRNGLNNMPMTSRAPVTRDTIYDCMKSTSNLCVDSSTQMYQQPEQGKANPIQQNYVQPTYSQPAKTSAPAAPTKRRVFGNGQELRKGQKVPLPITNNLRVCVGWNVKDSRCDVDISSFLLNDAKKVISDDWFVFYGMTNSPDHSCSLNVNGTNVDDKCVDINMNRLDPRVSRIIFVLTIDEALSRGLNFSMIQDAYIRLLNGNNELFRFMLTDYYNTVTSMMLGEIYKHNGAWKFAPIGDGVSKDLAGLCAMYGVQTD